MFKEKLKKVISIFQWMLTAVLVLVVLLMVFTAFNPVKSFQILRVMSGSMEPAVKVGSVVFIQNIRPEALKKGEIITFISAEDPNISVTHRLVAIEEKEGKTVFKTKGDANNTEDMTEVFSSQIKGKVVFSLPFLGYLSVWIKKPLGFALLVILPAILIIISEFLNIKKAIEKEVEKKYMEPEKQPKSKTINSLLIFFLVGVGLLQIKTTNAYFSDMVIIEGNTFSMANDWISPPITPVTGSVVINELMWMGSTVHVLDKWVELRNTTNSPINITGWKLYGAGPGPNGIVLVGTIGDNGYFLLSYYASDDVKSAINDSIIVDQVDNSVHLANSPGEQLTLKDTSDNIIDQTPIGSWVAGTHTSPATVEQSMERNDDPTTGWHTCIDIACNDTAYWDVEGNNYGTPKAPNLSENDPASFFPSPSPSLTLELSPTLSPLPTAESESSPNPSPTFLPEQLPSPTLQPTLQSTPTPTPTPQSTPTLMPSPASTIELPTYGIA